MRGGRAGAVVVIAGLAGAAAYAGMGGSSPSPPSTSSVPAIATTSRSATEEATTSQPVTTDVPATTVEVRAPEEVAREGMAAWGRFAVTGDLKEVAPWFAHGGPQWERFQTEAPDLAADPLGDPPYTVLVEEVAIHEEVATHDEGEFRVSAQVTFVRAGEPSQSFRWDIVLRRAEGRWLIWTVEDRQAEPSSP